MFRLICMDCQKAYWFPIAIYNYVCDGCMMKDEIDRIGKLLEPKEVGK